MEVEVFVQQFINGLTLESIYGLIAIGYTMVFGIIGMVNSAHGDVFMISTFIALIFFMLVTAVIGMNAGAIVIALILIMLLGMIFAGLWNWAIERIAYRNTRAGQMTSQYRRHRADFGAGTTGAPFPMRRVGLILNPYAGLGGPLALKGSDGCAAATLAAGAVSQVANRAAEALRALLPACETILWMSGGGLLGGDLLEALGFTRHLLHQPSGTVTTAADTRRLAQLCL